MNDAYYEHAREYIPNAKEVSVAFIEAGHFWTLENPEQATKALIQFLNAQEKGGR